MKALYIPIGILGLILGFSLWTGWMVARDTDGWIQTVEAADRRARSEDWAGAMEAMEEAYEGWSGRQLFYHTVMEHEELDKGEELFAGAFAVCGEEDGADFHTFASQLQNHLKLLAEAQGISIKNVL